MERKKEIDGKKKQGIDGKKEKRKSMARMKEIDGWIKEIDRKKERKMEIAGKKENRWKKRKYIDERKKTN